MPRGSEKLQALNEILKSLQKQKLLKWAGETNNSQMRTEHTGDRTVLLFCYKVGVKSVKWERGEAEWCLMDLGHGWLLGTLNRAQCFAAGPTCEIIKSMLPFHQRLVF